MKTALTIAGSDSSGGAGIQADIKTMTMNNVFATSAITALTAQNTTGVSAIMNVTPEFLEEQLDEIFTDIYPDAVKIGMVSESSLIHSIATKLKQYDAKHIVLDPVMVATSGAKLICDDAIHTLLSELVPLAEVITPNIPEAEVIAEKEIKSVNDMEEAARTISKKYGCSVLLKGGHNLNDANDYLYENGKGYWFKGKRINNPNTHGTGCTLSSAIASNLAKGYDLHTSVERGKDYISKALEAMLDLGKGSGPMNHMFDIKGEFSTLPTSSTYSKMSAHMKDYWSRYNEHPFVEGIEKGTLEKEKFRYYIIQDSLYLEEYAKVFAIGVEKATSLELANLFAKYIAVANGELDVHKGYLARLGVSEEELRNTPRSLENLSYTSYMIRVAFEEGEAEILAAILACAHSYEVIARRIVENNPDSINDEFYGTWIKGYSSDEYAAGNKILIDTLNKLTTNYTDKQITHLTDIYEACSKYELGFWDMSWNN